MTNKEFNEFYMSMLEMDEETLHNVVLGMAEVVRENQIKKERIKELEKLNDCKRERVM